MTATILYIEDNPLNMRLVRKILIHMGYNVLEAMDGVTGMKLIKEAQPDLVLMDVNLPDMDGLEVTRRLKSTPELSHIPVVALTANAMHGDRDQCILAGCDGYIAKPVARQELRNTISHFLSDEASREYAS